MADFFIIRNMNESRNSARSFVVYVIHQQVATALVD